MILYLQSWAKKKKKLEQTPGDSEGQGSLTHRGPLGHKESDTTEQ